MGNYTQKKQKMLRDYQKKALDQLYDWFRKHKRGHVCMSFPTGSGKSHIVAALCKDAVKTWPDTRILMLTHVKELIEQNAEKMRLHWPGAPLGIYSAGIGRRELGEPITFAGIQSVRNRADQLGHIDLIIVDECHLISHKAEGGYRKLIDALTAINPALRVVGLTATPFRLGHGLITDKPALFDALLDPVTIEELVYKGYLAPLRSKITEERLSVDGVHKRGGEYIERELQASVNTADRNQRVVDEVIALAGDRLSWLFFCAGVDHANQIARLLNARGIHAACVTGSTRKSEREQIIGDFKSGKIRALTNANVLTTGFDHPNVDLIAMLRPTLSPGLYIQMAGRGMRPKSHTDHCLVLDFAGVVRQHGPITAVQPPRRSGDGDGKAPVKVCESCHELVPLSSRQCPACGATFPEPEKPDPKLHDDDIMGITGTDMEVDSWMWRQHISRKSGKEMMAVTYYGRNLSDRPVTEYLPVTHSGYARDRAIALLAHMAQQAGAKDAMRAMTIPDVAEIMNDGQPPDEITVKREGKYFRVIDRRWNHGKTTSTRDCDKMAENDRARTA